MEHTNQKDLNKKLKNVEEKVRVGDLYYHFKDPTKHYIVESIGIIEDSEKICICYRALYGKEILWVRTLENFLEKVNGKTPRFIAVD